MQVNSVLPCDFPLGNKPLVLVPGRVSLPCGHQYCGTLFPPLLQTGKLYCLMLLSRRKGFLRHDSEKNCKPNTET